MSSEDQDRFESAEGSDADDGTTGIDRGTLLRRVAIGGAAVGLPGLGITESALGASLAGGGGNYARHPRWKFAFINHVTTNPFFVPTQYGAADACALVKCRYTWGGSTKADVGEMLNAFNAAISARPTASPSASSTSPRSRRRSSAPSERASPSSRTTPTERTRAPRPGWPTSARRSTTPASPWASGSRRSCRRATSRSSSRRPAR